MDVSIDRAREVDEELVAGLARLLAELTRRPPPAAEHLRVIVSNPMVELLVARDAQRELVGTLSLVLQPLPTGIRARVEDVVVTKSVRRSGIGQALMRAAIEQAKEAGASDIALTSNPRRVAARRLYGTLGFEPVETTVYRKTLQA